MNWDPPKRVVQIALVVGGLMDGWVALLTVLFPAYLGPLLDIPSHDRTWTLFAGAEFAVVAVLYFAILRDLERFRPLMLVVALDQFLACFGPLVMIARGELPGTWKTIGPLPVNFALFVILSGAALQRNAAQSKDDQTAK